ncbi:DUF547 domain-containing protein [Saprospiraceae bacterium]|nr:DUF547 domain-containing protein [Saprospiraceae bacterium]
MKYLFSALVLSALLMISCKSDTSSTASTSDKASTMVDKGNKKVAEANTSLKEGMNNKEMTEDKGMKAAEMDMDKKDMSSTKEMDKSMDKAMGKVDEMKAGSKAAAASVKENASKMKSTATATKETATNAVRDKVAETKVKAAEAKATSTPEVRTDPNLKVTVPIAQGERKPSPDNMQHTEKVEKVKKDINSKVPNKPGTMNTDHTVFNNILKAHVSSSGVVDYAGIKAKKGDLEGYLTALSKVDPSSLSKSERLAFWINAYNASTIMKIVENYPVGSIKDLNGGKPWDDKFIKLDGKTLSLNDIENGIIRPQFKEPRIHFAVNCAAKSCPPIHNGAYSAGNLNTNMENSAKAFINNPTYNQISADKVVISNIFNWYGEDFGNIIDFLNKYSDTKINSNAKVEYNEYNWKLNGK